MNKKTRNNIWIFTAVVGLLIFLSSLKIFVPIQASIQETFNPLLKPVYSVATLFRNKYDEQASIDDLNRQIEVLAEERNKFAAENIKIKMITEENDVLREQLRFLSKNQYRYIVSNVISRGGVSGAAKISETIIIDKGLKDGVYNGLSVIVGDGIIVGKVTDAKEAIAKVDLTTSNYCKLAATIFGDNKTSGITEGEMGLTVRMGFIPQSAIVEKDDLVVTSGLEETIPRGLIIGKVIEAKNEKNDLWQSAVIEPLVATDGLIIVSVLLP